MASWLPKLLPLFASLCGAALSPAAAEVRIGYLTTLSGPFHAAGLQQFHALQLAVLEINSGGGIAGNTVELFVQDTQGRPEIAIASFQKLAFEDKVIVVLGPLFSHEAFATLHYANKLQVPIITASSSDPRLTGPEFPWSFRFSLTSETIQSDGILKWKKYTGVRNVTIIFDKRLERFHWEGTILLPKILASGGLSLINQISFVGGGKNYFEAEARMIQNTNADGLVVIANAIDTANVVHELWQLGYDKPVYAVASPYPQIRPQDFGYLGKLDFYFPTEFWIDQNNKRGMEFRRKLVASNNLSKTDIVLPSTAAIYDAIYAVKTVLEEAGVDLGDLRLARKSIAELLPNLRDFPGVTGILSISADHDAIHKAYLIAWKSGKHQVISD